MDQLKEVEHQFLRDPHQDNAIYFSYGTSAAIAANTNVVTRIKFDLAASSILASRATFNSCLDSTTDVTLSSYGSEPLTIGPECQNIGIDGNEIQARANGAAAKLFLNSSGGEVHFGSGVTTIFHLMAQITTGMQHQPLS
jgi:hypothetical protein